MFLLLQGESSSVGGVVGLYGFPSPGSSAPCPVRFFPPQRLPRERVKGTDRVEVRTRLWHERLVRQGQEGLYSSIFRPSVRLEHRLDHGQVDRREERFERDGFCVSVRGRGRHVFSLCLLRWWWCCLTRKRGRPNDETEGRDGERAKRYAALQESCHPPHFGSFLSQAQDDVCEDQVYCV